jgi:hypothetical protein
MVSLHFYNSLLLVEETELGEEEALDLVELTMKKLTIRNQICDYQVGGLAMLFNFCGLVF